MQLKSPNNILYRYRSNLDPKDDHNIFNELNQQEIYCAPPSELNDPMEGLHNVYWDGDSIIWENLIKNYLLSLLKTFGAFIVAGSTLSFGNPYPVLIFTQDDLTKQEKEFYNSFVHKVFKKNAIKRLPKQLEEKGKVGRYELITHLNSIHVLTFKILMEEASERNLCPKIHVSNTSLPLKIRLLQKSFSMIKNTDLINSNPERFFSIFEQAADKLHFSSYYEHKENPVSNDILFNNSFSITTLFPRLYVEELISSLYPNNYIAALSALNNNASMWAHYAKAHKGICLQFRLTQDGEGNLFLPTQKQKQCKCYKVEYGKYFQSENFFELIGILPLEKIRQYWWRKDDKYSNISHAYKDEKSWRKRYWENFVRFNTFKHEDWKYENEWRIMESSMLQKELPKAQCVINYNFECLEGIIFGMRTSYDDKYEIIKIIKEKCKDYKRAGFKFFQAEYPTYGDKMHISEAYSIG